MDKRHIIVHAVGGRVVHKHRARAHDLRRVETGDVALGGAEHDIEPRKFSSDGSWIMTGRPFHSTTLPALRLLANRRSSEIGN